MKLYSYDHCPYCVKARMIFGLKNVPFELVTLLNDDEENPIRMIGKKMCPILEKDDGTFMPESLDIVAYVDGLSEYGPISVKPSSENRQLNTWLQDIRNYHYRLAMPRWPQMGLDEFKTESAIAYFTRKKEMAIGPFTEALAKTPEYLEMAHSHLKILEEMMPEKGYFNGDEISIDDFHLFASLRCLTTAKDLEFPPKIDSYMNRLSEKSKVPLHWEKAI